MPVSDKDIVNQGLIHLGERSIPSLTSGGTRRQEIASVLYQPTRRALLSEINWRFATHTQQLAQITTTPANTRYKYAYALPTDPVLLKPQYVRPNGQYAIEGDQLLTNHTSVLMTYTADADESVMPAYFSYLLGLRMAWVMAMPITKKQSKEDSMKDKMETYEPKAFHADAGQQPNEPVRDAPFIDVRS